MFISCLNLKYSEDTYVVQLNNKQSHGTSGFCKIKKPVELISVLTTDCECKPLSAHIFSPSFDMGLFKGSLKRHLVDRQSGVTVHYCSRFLRVWILTVRGVESFAC